MSQDQLPKAIRRLIRATIEHIKSINIRADEGVQLEGIDGILEVESGNEFVPDGKSVWELVTNKQVKTKALETWLESATAVHLWLTVMLGKHPETAFDIENFGADWTEVTSPTITSELINSGRNQEVEKIQEWLNKLPSALALHAESKSEAIAQYLV